MNENTVDNKMIELFESVALLEVVHNNGNISRGTGFFVSLRNDSSITPVMVTNNHVLKDIKTVTIYKEAGNDTVKKEKIVLDQDVEQFIIRHETKDLCMLLMGHYNNLMKDNGISLNVSYIDESIIGYERNINFFSDAMIIGYPKGLSEHKSYHPFIYTGKFAYPPSHKYNDVIDMVLNVDSHGGNSGSPIYALDLKNHNMNLIGILSSGYAPIINEELNLRDNLTLSIGIDVKALKDIKKKIADLYKDLTGNDID
ncbi:hypothetical protein E4T89_06880 [Jeotgalicoccus nanhaiensis]|uniref:Trypsin-like peptidase domain-containing protein n=1 Tax=Jeotgalicoccus nanhaiensis TaxID=568603 RepID=A0ABR9XYC8_9STAP|nr:trypsin-like peptidase domain-containing protein [Jeotgalicoccus nanhaiensis]MBF0754000.1 trypsin-like peptidase domain-containing protein [Jeotgalicoccus nanhaiensis]TFU61487.1 hypothetical protein E4T89_06880 [Jeotgalicoccus nanhaiensis]